MQEKITPAQFARDKINQEWGNCCNISLSTADIYMTLAKGKPFRVSIK